MLTPDWDIELIALSKDGRRLAYVTNEDGYSRLRVRVLETGQDLEAPAYPPGVVQSVSWRPDGEALAFVPGRCLPQSGCAALVAG